MSFPLVFPYVFGGSGSVVDLITDHADLARDRLAEQFKNQPQLAALLDTLNLQVQDIENALWQLLTERGMTTAVGAQLDVLGRIVGQPRQGQSDETYRLYLKARVLLNLSSGSTEDIYGIFHALVSTSTTLEVRPQYPATFVLRLGGEAFTPEQIDLLVVFLRSGKAGGVRAILQWYATAPVFRFDSGPGFDQGHLAGETE